MNRLIIIGAGGHGQVVADAVRAANRAGAGSRLLGFADDGLAGGEVDGYPVLCRIDETESVEHDGFVVAIGDNRLRAETFDRLASRGKKPLTIIHPAAVVADNAVLGAGVVVCAGVVVNAHAEIGDDVILNTGCTVDHHVRIGAHAHIGPGAHLAGNVAIGSGTLIGIGAAVIPGRVIGEWAVIGAAAAVVEDVPAGAVAVGVPARCHAPASMEVSR